MSQDDASQNETTQQSEEEIWLGSTLNALEANSVSASFSLKVKLTVEGEMHTFNYADNSTFPMLRAKVYETTGWLLEWFTAEYMDEEGDLCALYRDSHFDTLRNNTALWVRGRTLKVTLHKIAGATDTEMMKRWLPCDEDSISLDQAKARTRVRDRNAWNTVGLNGRNQGEGVVIVRLQLLCL
jgi:hypothetical protein